VSEPFLPDTCIGAYYARTSTGTERYFAFTRQRIYEYNQTDLNWTDVTGTSGVYTTPSAWSVVQFGTYLYATNGQDPEQRIDLDAGTIFVDNLSAPKAKYLAVIGDFLVRGSIEGYPNRVQWSAVNDPTSNTVAIDGSDIQNLAEGEEVMGIIPMSFGAIIACRTAFHTMQFALSSEWVFTFNLISRQKGTQSPWSITVLNRDDFVVYCNDGFMRGPSFIPIAANKLDKWFINDTDSTGRAGIVASVDPVRKVVWFLYQRVSSDYRLLGYDWELERWTVSDMQVQAIFRARTFGTTIDGMDNYFDTIDDCDDPFDSPAYDSGTEQTGIISAGGNFGYLSGSPQAAHLVSSEVSLNDTNRAFVNGARLDGDAVDVAVTLATGEYKGSDLVARSAASPSERTRYIPLRGDGRVHQVTLDVAEGADWSIISAIDLDVKGSGRS
jgi:hypothetical protein